MADRVIENFGDYLRTARERHGVSLKHISQKTKIGLRYLEALERNDIAQLPGGIFSRGFVRAYAIEVGLDPERTVQEFLEWFADDDLAVGRPQIEIEDNQLIVSQQRAAETALKLLLVSAPIALALFYFTMGRDTRVGPAEEPEGYLPAAAELRLMDVRPAVAPVPYAARDARAGALTVELRPSRPCWVSATVDGERILSRLLQEGEGSVLRADQEIVLTAGDAGALALAINGESARSLGEGGQVVTARITPENYRSYLSRR